ncbi:N-acetyltransferase family protein [Chishuiella sp.]|uniref:GNAT family N-acetyltransferase n=1 Tax=Chishuiella sp. TaxID=1969467 RepID=UPI0028AA21BC|nr:N-acetyltransferase family protein [Chishuiella sp.]
MIELLYRNATQNDLKKITEIYNSTIPSRLVTADTEPVSVESKQQWFNEHSANKRPLWIVEDNEKNIIGWVSFQSFYGRPAYDGTVEISIYLDENYQGKGLGKKILQYCLNKAPEFEIKTILGFIFSHNEPSIKLFKHFGFEVWGQLPNIAILDNINRSLSILGKRIDL